VRQSEPGEPAPALHFARAIELPQAFPKVIPMALISDRDLFDFLEHTADAAFAVTDAGEICSWNSSAEALFGFGRDEVIGRTCFELFEGRGAFGAPETD
jgi:PAS domain-containing protein